jgi:hypothetical protein
MKAALTILWIFLSVVANAQPYRLKPGFEPKEYIELLSLSYFGHSNPDSIKRKTTEDKYRLVFKSKEAGFRNRWQLFIREDSVAVIELRGTQANTASWLANFYAAMIPAAGVLQLNDSTSFPYRLADDPKALVHAGWTIGMAHLAPEIVNAINRNFTEKKINEYLIIGHSQGGALAFLVRSYLEYMRMEKRIPADIRFKTYASAAPKPGNMYYAYAFDYMNRGGWAFNVVNAADWVPETPMSIQTVYAFNKTNPFSDISPFLKNLKFPARLAGRYVYNKIKRSSRKAEKRMNRFLGPVMFRQARKILPELREPAYAKGTNYMRAGNPVILMPDQDYYEKFPDNREHIFIHHSFNAYYFLLKKDYLTE